MCCSACLAGQTYGAVIVYLLERHAPHYRVTTPRRMTACFAMGIGMLTLASVAA